jgi:hypothetical protein
MIDIFAKGLLKEEGISLPGKRNRPPKPVSSRTEFEIPSPMQTDLYSAIKTLVMQKRI